jgi:LysM repeat protein
MQVARQRRSHDRQSRLSAAALGMFGGLAAVIAFSMFSDQPTNTTINTRQIAAASKHLRQLEVAVDTARAERERLQLDLSTLAARRSQLGREFATIRVEYGQLVATLQQMVAARQDYLVSFSEQAISEKLLETTTAGDASSASQTSNRASSQTTQRASTGVTTTNTIATYQVLPGDTLWTIANRHDVTVSSLAEANGVNELETLVAGRLLVLKTNAPISTTDASEADGRQPDTSPPPGTPFVRAIHYLVSVRSSPRAWIPYASGIS